MRFKQIDSLTVACFLATLFSVMSCVAYGSESTTVPSGGELATACRKAIADFRPLGASDVQNAQKGLIEALDRLDQRLAQDGTNGEAWRKFLELGTLRQQLALREGPNKTVLSRLLARYNTGYDGLELVWFLDVQRALHHYLAVTYAVDNPKIRAAFEALLAQLADKLEKYAVKPTTEDALVISESLRWLENAEQVPTLVQWIQKRYVQPNLFGSISPAILGAGIKEHVDETIPIRDCILGTDIYGTAHTIGQTNVQFVPSSDFGVLDALFSGTTTSENVGYHGPVTIYSNASTDLSGCKRLWIHPGGLSAYPGVSQATTNVQICNIQAKRAIIERMAWKRAGKQQAKAESIASTHAEERLNERIDQQADESLERANRAYIDKFYQPFTERKLFPQELRFSTTEQAISMVGLQAGGGKLAAPNTPPPVNDKAEMSLRLHESMINNLAFDALAGRTIYEEKVQAAVKETLGHLPEKMKGDDDGRPWAITFAPRQPISVSFVDDGFKITLRGMRFCKGSEIHNDPMNITAVYKIEQTPKGVKAVRQGDIQVFPPDFEPGQQVGGRQQVIRKLLEKRFEKIFEPEILGEGFELSGKWKAAGKLLPIEVVCRDGWLVIGWRRASAEPK
jgi:hypothetical protein